MRQRGMHLLKQYKNAAHIAKVGDAEKVQTKPSSKGQEEVKVATAVKIKMPNANLDLLLMSASKPTSKRISRCQSEMKGFDRPSKTCPI